MSIRVLIPTPLRQLTGGAGEVAAEGATVADVIASLDARHPGLKARLCDDEGDLRRFVNVYVDGEDIRFIAGLTTPVKPGSAVSIVPAIAGG
ncbi:MAG: MoaD/ThiS family protein [Chloroflexi bacterium]|nr:MoaD/ThiS family protein [Chloroflexota bacterium]MBI4507693.1 MoaD/ThiS family protein [Chloroflexota bacterium]